MRETAPDPNAPAAPLSAHGLDALFQRHAGAALAEALRARVPELPDGAGPDALARAVTDLDLMAQALLDRGGETDEHLRGVLRACVDALGRCLEVSDAPRELRRHALRALVDVLDADRDGAVAGGLPELLLERCLADERPTVAAWLRALGDDEDLPADESSETPWDRLRHAALIFDLVEDELPEAAFARACRLLRRDAQLCEHHLIFGRLDDALAVARAVELQRLPEVIEVLARHGHAAEAEPIVDARTAPDPALRARAQAVLDEARRPLTADVLRSRATALFARRRRACDREAAAWVHLALRAMPPEEGAAWLKSLRQSHIERPAVREALARAGLSSAQ